jgi:uncharacterized protein (DUF58 family)
MGTRLFYLIFHFLTGVQFRLERRFTRAGLLALGGLGASAVVGLDTNQTMAYQAFTLLLALLGLSLGWSARWRARLTVRRSLPRFVTAGDPFSYRLVVQNETPKAQSELTVTEVPLDPRPSFEDFRRTVAPGESRANRWDRTVGYPRWLWLVTRNRGAGMQEQALPALPPGGETEIRAEIVPLRRSHLRFTGVTVARPDPLGLCRASVTVPAPQSILVLPRRYPLPAIELPGSRRYQPGGVALAGSVGDSEEFVALREYRPGDPLRRIHWRSWAKAGKPVVKEYQDEFILRHALVLDTFAKTGLEEDSFEEAVSVAASFAWSVQTQDSLLDLMFVGHQAYCFTAGRGVGHAERMLEILACVQACRDQPFRALHHAVLARHASLSGCIAVLLGWDGDRQDFIHHLRVLGVPTLVLVVTAAGAAAPGPDEPGVHRLEIGRIAEGLAKL